MTESSGRHLLRQSLVLAPLALASSVVGAAVFSSSQAWEISSPAEWSQVCQSDYVTGAFTCADANYGYYRVGYDLPFGTWKTFYLYNWTGSGFWEEAVYLLDEQL